MRSKYILFVFLVVMGIAFSCTPGGNPGGPVLSSSKSIQSFIFKAADNPGIATDYSGTIGADTIYVNIAPGTNVSALIPVITIIGASVSPANHVAQNFSNPITYTVKADDGSTKTYVVVLRISSPGGTVFINTSINTYPDGGNLYAIDANTGHLKWKYPVPSVTGNMTFYNGIIFMATGQTMLAIDTMTRTVKWQFVTGGFIQSVPQVINGILYFNCNDFFLYALDAVTGSLKWKYAEIPSQPVTGGNASSPTVVNGAAYFADLSGNVYALDATNGTIKWKRSNIAGVNAEISSSPCVVNNVLYIGDTFHDLIALNTNDGSLKWIYTTNSQILSSPAVDNGNLYFGCSDHNIYAVDAATGALKWQHVTSNQVDASPLVSNGIVYIGTDDGASSVVFYALDANTGAVKWYYISEFTLRSSPILMNGILYAASLGSIFAFDALTGVVKWRYMFDSIYEGTEDLSPFGIDAVGNIYYPSISGNRN